MSTFPGILNSFSNPVIADALLAQRRKAMQAGQPRASPPTNPAIDTQALIDQRVGQAQVPQGTPTAEGLLADTTHQANVAGVASPDRRIRNQSGQELYGNYARDILPGPAADQLEDIQRAGPHEQHGFVGHLKGFLKGLALGGVGGSAVGAVDPNIPERAIYQNRLSLAEHRAAQERQRQMQELSAGQDYSQQTGRDLNGNLTEQAKNREMQLQSIAAQRQWQQQQGQEKAAETERWHKTETERRTAADKSRFASQRLNTLRHVYEAGGMNEQQRQEFASLAGVSGALGEAYQKGEADIQPDEKGRLFVVHKRTGYKEPVVDPDTGQQMISFKVTQEANKKEIAANAQAGANQRAAMRGAGRMTRAQAETQAAKELGAGTDGMIDNPAWKEAYDRNLPIARGAYPNDEAAAQAMAERRTVKDVKGQKRIPANKHPEFHLKVQGLMGSATASASDPRIGKTFKDKSGKQYRITGIDADGQPIGIPIQ